MTCKFTNPFRYSPHSLVRSAAESVISDLDRRIEEDLLPYPVCQGFKEGKMLGVLVCKDETSGNLQTLAAFSGTVGGQSLVEGFVPPIYDLMDPDGYYKKMEAEITDMNDLIKELSNASEYYDYRKMLWMAESERDSALEEMRERMAASKIDREQRRAAGCAPDILIKESQFEKAEFRRLKLSYKARIQEIVDNLQSFKNIIDEHKQRRAAMSDELQDWIFKQYKVHNFLGEESTIHGIFSSQELTPPGGTGECAAPKLLEYAYCKGLKPLAMGEFWYGTSPKTAVRTHGHFYPSCTSKCGPLLGYMLKGLELENSDTTDVPEPVIIHEDKAIIAISKPSGMPSVPGLDGRPSAQEWAEEKLGPLHTVHRLDMDTSGVLLFAKTAEVAVKMQKQFESHNISKRYIARLCSCSLNEGDNGSISLPLSADYDERPRQKVDRQQGKYATTFYKVIGKNSDGTVDIEFLPITGRTHQLRVHSAHHQGLGSPILGDMLYGGHGTATLYPQRLHLHAQSITFKHPATGKEVTICSSEHSF